MKVSLLTVIVLIALIGSYVWISYSHLSPSVQTKRAMLDRELMKQGYESNYFLLSGYRPPWLNRLMPLSAKKSVHQQGLAIDLFVMDIDGNDRFDDADLRIITSALDILDKRNPTVKGGVGLYHRPFRRMVHFDVSGTRRRWDN